MELIDILEKAQKATLSIALADENTKNNVLETISAALIENQESIFFENKKDLDKMEDTDPKKDRLLLNEQRLKSIAESIIKVTKLPDPSGKIITDKILYNGLQLQKKYVPMGVVGVIYESRPNVTIDVSVLNIKSGNVTILRGGSDTYHTNLILLEIIQNSLVKNNLDKNIVQLMPTDRKLVKELLEAENYVDMLIPRGSQSLIDFVRENAKVPVIETGAGVCHTYVEKTGDPKMGADIIANAKIQRPSVCNALDTVILDREVAENVLSELVSYFSAAGVKIYADERSFDILQQLNYPHLNKATEEDFGREFLSLQCSVKTVDGFIQAIDHIRKHSSKHSECIVTENNELAEKFLEVVDAAAVYHNASTRFTDGEEFDLGAEIGISTQKLHARGPFALEKLVTEKWIVRGTGQIRK